MLPIVGGYTTMRLDLCELLIEISSEHMEKTRRLEIQQKNKPTIERVCTKAFVMLPVTSLLIGYVLW